MEFDDPVEDQPVVRQVDLPPSVASQLKIATWQENFNDHQPIYFQVYLMKDSYFVWIGSNPASFATLNVAAMTPSVRPRPHPPYCSYFIQDSSPQVSTIHGSNTEGAGRSIAARLGTAHSAPSPRLVPSLFFICLISF